jgi:hypothetical protein
MKLCGSLESRALLDQLSNYQLNTEDPIPGRDKYSLLGRKMELISPLKPSGYYMYHLL